jgi:hypothetical protein
MHELKLTHIRLAEEMADAVGGSLRPVMVPSPVLRWIQRIDVQLNAKAVRAAFEGWQYCACLPGGTECLGWIARLCWDNGIPLLVGDVPNGFPGVKHSEVLAAMEAELPGMVPSFLRWSERGTSGRVRGGNRGAQLRHREGRA